MTVTQQPGTSTDRQLRALLLALAQGAGGLSAAPKEIVPVDFTPDMISEEIRKTAYQYRVVLYADAPGEVTLEVTGLTPSGVARQEQVGRFDPRTSAPRLTMESVKEYLAPIVKDWRKIEGRPRRGRFGVWQTVTYVPPGLSALEIDRDLWDL